MKTEDIFKLLNQGKRDVYDLKNYKKLYIIEVLFIAQIVTICYKVINEVL